MRRGANGRYAGDSRCDARSRCLLPPRACSRRPCVRAREAHALQAGGKEQAFPKNRRRRLARAAQRLTCLRPRGMTCWLSALCSVSGRCTALPFTPSSQAVVRNLPRKSLPVQRHDENPAKPCEKGIYYCSRYCAQGVPGVSIRSDPARVESGLHGPRVDTASRRGASARSAPAHNAAGPSYSRMNPARAHGTKDVCRACACRSEAAVLVLAVGAGGKGSRQQLKARQGEVRRPHMHACVRE